MLIAFWCAFWQWAQNHFKILDLFSNQTQYVLTVISSEKFHVHFPYKLSTFLCLLAPFEVFSLPEVFPSWVHSLFLLLSPFPVPFQFSILFPFAFAFAFSFRSPFQISRCSALKIWKQIGKNSCFMLQEFVCQNTMQHQWPKLYLTRTELIIDWKRFQSSFESFQPWEQFP